MSKTKVTSKVTEDFKGDTDAILGHIRDELFRAVKLHPKLNSVHEAYSVIFEELDEFWDECKKNRASRSADRMFDELVQIAAMSCRTILDLMLIQRK